MAEVVTLKLLGTAGVVGLPGDTAPVQGQSLALLAALAWAGERGLARDKLVALLWPETSASRASHRLSQLAHWTRRTLGSPGLITGAADLRLDRSAVACDLFDFAEARRSGDLERAAATYAGPFLDGFFLADAPEFERWVESRRAELAREYEETLEALALHAEARSDLRAAAEWWGRLSRHEPLSSRVTMHLMTALAASGERARALALAQAYQQQVRIELEAEPNPAVLALAHVLKREPRGDAPPQGSEQAIGILPFAALGDEPAARSLAEALTEELTSAMAELAGVRVAARTALSVAQQTTPDLRELAERLGLGALLEGSVRIAGGRLRITLRLVDATDGCQRWSERWDGDAGQAVDDASLAQELAERVGRRLHPG